MYLQPEMCYSNFKKVTEKLKKTHYLKNGGIYQKMHETKKM